MNQYCEKCGATYKKISTGLTHLDGSPMFKYDIEGHKCATNQTPTDAPQFIHDYLVDASPEYVQMCFKSGELQELYEARVHYKKMTNKDFVANHENGSTIWIPTATQLQFLIVGNLNTNELFIEKLQWLNAQVIEMATKNQWVETIEKCLLLIWMNVNTQTSWDYEAKEWK